MDLNRVVVDSGLYCVNRLKMCLRDFLLILNFDSTCPRQSSTSWFLGLAKVFLVLR